MTELTPYSEYKDSRVPWLGEIPSHWDLMHGGALLQQKQVKNRGMIESTVLSLSYGRIVVKPPEKLHGLVPESFETYQVVDPDEIIVRPTDLQNDWKTIRVGISHNRGIITSAYLCFRTKKILSPDYAHLLLLGYDLKKIFYGMGSGLRQNLDWSDFKRLPVLLPPAEEQKAIHAYIKQIDHRINRFIHNRRRLIEVLNEQKQAIINRAVTRGLNPDVPLKPSGIDWLGDIPEHWRVVAFKWVLRNLIDCEHKTAPAVEGSEYYVIRTTAVRNGRLRLSGAYCTTAVAFAQWTQRGLPEVGDVIFTREAPAGEACLVPEDITVCLGQRTVLMKLRRDHYDPEFLIFMIYCGPPAHRIRLASQGSTVGHFNMDDIAAMRVLVPPLTEQKRIVAAVKDRTNSLDGAIAKAEREIDLIREYRTRLIADVVTGKVDVRHLAPEDVEREPADLKADLEDEITGDEVAGLDQESEGEPD